MRISGQALAKLVAAGALVVACAADIGCAHAVTIASRPAGADVIVNGKVVGRTPYRLDEQSGRDDLVPVEVQHREKTARFAYKRTGLNSDALMASLCSAGGMCVLGGAGLVGLVLAVPAAVLVLTDPTVALFLVLGAYTAYLVGVILIAEAPYAVILGVGEGARQGPDRIDVDFTQPVPLVTTTPADMAVPFVGRTPRSGGRPQRY